MEELKDTFQSLLTNNLLKQMNFQPLLGMISLLLISNQNKKVIIDFIFFQSFL